MSRKGNCWDKAVAESFFSSLKKERIKKQIYKNREFAVANVAQYIDSFYNSTRRHSHLGGVSPGQFEATHEPLRRVSTKSWELQSRPPFDNRTVMLRRCVQPLSSRSRMDVERSSARLTGAMRISYPTTSQKPSGPANQRSGRPSCRPSMLSEPGSKPPRRLLS